MEHPAIFFLLGQSIQLDERKPIVNAFPVAAASIDRLGSDFEGNKKMVCPPSILHEM